MIEDPGNRAVMTVPPKQPAQQDIRFRVQFASSSRKKAVDKFKELDDVRVYEHNGMYKYTSGNQISYAEAIKLQNSVRSHKKYRDAFIVAFKGDERINVDEARDLTGQ